jgi:hypothetical protein
MKTAPDLYYGKDAELFAGQRVPAGEYMQLDTYRIVRFDRPDTLPASLDGHVAVYVRRASTWADIHSQVDAAGSAARNPPFGGCAKQGNPL